MKMTWKADDPCLFFLFLLLFMGFALQERTDLRQRLTMADQAMAQMKDSPNLSKSDWQKLRRDLDHLKKEADMVLKEAEQKLARYPVPAGGGTANAAALAAGGSGTGAGTDGLSQDMQVRLCKCCKCCKCAAIS